MFERLVRLARARKALKNGQLEQAVQLTEDPILGSHRRGEELRHQALDRILDRARARAAAGQWASALADASRVLAHQPEHDAAQNLAAELRGRLGDEEERGRTARQLLAKARGLAERGDVQTAVELHRQAVELGGIGAEGRLLEQFLHGRSARARELLERAASRRRGGELEAAMADCAQARALDRGAVRGSAIPRRVARDLGVQLASSMGRRLAAGDDRGAYGEYQRQRRQLPELEDVEAVRSRVREIVTRLRRSLAVDLDEKPLEPAVQTFLGNDPRLLEEPGLGTVVPTARGLLKALDLEAQGHFRAAAQVYGAAGRELGVGALKTLAKEVGKRGGQAAGVIETARGLAADGQLTEARGLLTEILEKWPMHEGVRREIELLDQGAVSRSERMATARELSREGRLREASAMALTLAVAGPAGEDARMLLKEVQARLDLVSKGLDEVRLSVHGMDSGSPEGIRHCILRLEQLKKLQADHEELPVLDAALAAELEGLGCHERAVAALASGDQRQAAEALAEVGALRPRLLSEDRLDARILDIADRICSWAEESARSGKLTAARECVDVLQSLKSVQPELGQRLDTLHSILRVQQERGEELARRGRELLAQRNLDDAEEHLCQARNVWVESPGARELERSLSAVRAQEHELQQVETLTQEADYEGAQRQLGRMPPTPPALRTRIFDMKKDLAKAQGLDNGFVLRVDEGGEFLVLRGESVSIGNVRDGKSDLPLLANIAGQHARIQRTMSFHGGMQDRVVTEKGTVLVGDRLVESHRLRSGDRFRLGKNLTFAYGVPSSRSLSAVLTVLGGFQVEGTDQILLMKDRGRDGRILIGGGSDVHVRVPNAEGEIEIFANQIGQVRVRFAGRGTMDGKPFSGEHPVTAGATVQCGPVSFVLLPRSRPV